MNISKLMKGKKTYAFLLVSFLGLLGVSDLISEGEAAELIDIALQFFGLLGAVYGRYVANKKV